VRRFVQRLERAGRRSKIRIARAEVDDIDTSGEELALFLRNRREGILGKRLKSTSQLRH
jgi:hypothetical protein